MDPLISVIVPVYNIENYIKRCIDSIISQTYRNLEIFLVDDGSKDKSGQICDEYASRDVRITVIHKENGGLSDARNAAIDVAHGEWITFVDGDDFLTNTAIESMYHVVEMFGVQIVCCLHKLVYEGKHSDFDEAYDENNISVYSQEKALEKMLRQSEIIFSAWAKLYSAKLFCNIRYPKGELYEDLATTYKLFAEVKNVALIRIEGYGYVVRSGSIQQSKFSKGKMVQLRFAEEQKEFLDKQFPELENATTECLVSVCFHILFAIMGSNEFEAEKKKVKKIIRENRKKLLFSKRTSKKARFGCLLSYLGFDTEYWVYSKLGIRGKIIY